ncbi:MAG: hemerythrin domain-containing protein [Lachnospiraceae bacterium]|nr:hemerythrin domain-containing protein [Lachnospiraceae bacterium]
MNYCIEIMEEEHANIQRMIAVIRQICCNILEGGEVPVDDLRSITDFIKNYADHHHHGKEEAFLFPEMVARLGKMADNLVTHGMLVEHNLGRNYNMGLSMSLDAYEASPSTQLKLDIVGNAFGYSYVLSEHVLKENNVVYTFAEKNLPQEVFDKVNEDSRKFEEENMIKGTQKHYLDMLEGFEKKYLNK